MQHRQDPVIQLLFGFAKDIFGTDIQEYENFFVVLKQICNQANSQFSKHLQDKMKWDFSYKLEKILVSLAVTAVQKVQISKFILPDKSSGAVCLGESMLILSSNT
ncbi:hypothetical protein PHYBLDRAFT_70674 [Phycomyces blakesleeanus NRRL 1555(-)]|uniref:Uncharacterized protein n=1 Tax=Phycomyces blakesleeanus (strain ATCC 8743b / DSM 1359 / FGSC 10004 / NBRC 33097 / NRRL 1555) TaxID=763407 RepID=A0A167LGJ4_PHYB8|nr:hypothetical protein PHYBLDRAFT_70674 [Phycomyces blakesleeanus NRRL 1555(-)]OAD70407.1 hypothetical protein PHYBLDRAFT_70674 [Phycomyces blakesleeanus NRRL 1555(-)]|eukprot:XP_018288447.1 hypothetical protein PHYBLDRAFT_70674 [Phycomyces blakesleeanus NRRL 1555(-)]